MIPFIVREKRKSLESYFRKRKVVLKGTLPSSFDDISTTQFYKLRKCDDVYDQIEILSGISAGSWRSIVNPDHVTKWMAWMVWEDLERIERPKFISIAGCMYVLKDDIGKDSFAQKIIAQRKFASCKTQEDQIKIIPELVAIYLQPYFDRSGLGFDADKLPDALIDVMRLPISIVLPLGNYIIKDLFRILEREARTLKYTPDRKELLAGVNDLSKFGEKNLVDALAGGDVLKHNDVLKLPYNTVYLKLYQDSVRAKINKKYSELSTIK